MEVRLNWGRAHEFQSGVVTWGVHTPGVARPGLFAHSAIPILQDNYERAYRALFPCKRSPTERLN